MDKSKRIVFVMTIGKGANRLLAENRLVLIWVEPCHPWSIIEHGFPVMRLFCSTPPGSVAWGRTGSMGFTHGYSNWTPPGSAIQVILSAALVWEGKRPREPPSLRIRYAFPRGTVGTSRKIGLLRSPYETDLIRGDSSHSLRVTNF